MPDEKEMIAALIEAREVLDIITANRRKHGPIATKAQTVAHHISRVLDAAGVPKQSGRAKPLGEK